MSIFGTSIDDPRTQMILAMASGLLGNRGNLAQGMSAGLMGGVGAFNDARKMQMLAAQQAAAEEDRRAQAEQRRAQIEAAQREAARQEQVRGYFGAIGQPVGLGAKVNPQPLEFSLPGLMRAGGTLDDAKKFAEVGQIGQPEFTNFRDVQTPEGPRVVGLGKRGESKVFPFAPVPKSPLVNVSTGGNKDWMKSIVDAVQRSAGSAEAAASTISTLSRIRDSVASGANIGPGATFSQFGGQLLVKAGMAGKDEAEKVANTRTLIQALAQTDLDLAKSMIQGQGAVSNFEREAITKAALGGIDSLTQPEFAAVVSGLEKTQRYRIQEHQRKIKSLPPELGGPSGLGNFFNVEMPPQLAPIPISDTTIKTPGQSTRRINNPVQWGQ